MIQVADSSLTETLNWKQLEPAASWGRTADKQASSMHSIASYLAMFTSALPKFFIDRFSKKDDLIYDPFAGRGTVGLKAREMNRRFIGGDLNPYAVVLARSKMVTISKQTLLTYVDQIEQEFKQWIIKHQSVFKKKIFQELTYFYSPKVLNQLIFLREEYGVNWRRFSDPQNALFGFVFGLMHGPARKDHTSLYFSLSMPNTISMAPNYVHKYAKKHRLKKPQQNIFDLIKARINKKYDVLLSQFYNGKVYEHDALQPNNKVQDHSVDLLITCPPYLNLVNYAQANWLRLWLLGYNRNELKTKVKLRDSLKKDEYQTFISEFLTNVSLKLRSRAHVVLVVGADLLNRHYFLKEVSDLYELIEIYKENIPQQKKTTNMLNSKRGKAVKSEQVFLLRRV